MPRPDAKHNQVEEVLKTLLSAINSVTDANSWLTKPLSVKRGFTFADWTNGPRPALYIETTDWDVTDRNTRHQCIQRLAIACVCDGTTPGFIQLNRLQADVLFAILRQPSSEYPALADGSRIEKLSVTHGEPAYEKRVESKLAVSVITIEARYVFDHTAAT